MLREKAVKFAKVMFTGLMLSFGMTVLAPASPVEAEILEESEPNDNPATADVLPLNTWIKGKIDKEYEEDWYQFTITERSYTQFYIQPSPDNTDRDTWKVTLEDQDRHVIFSDSYYSAHTKPLGLMPGKYYIHITTWEYGNYQPYNFEISNIKSDEWEYEQYYRNKSQNNANIAYVGRRYTGLLYNEDDVDYFRFKLNGTNNVSVKFNIDDTVSNPGRWCLEFIEYNSRKSFGTRYLSTNETYTVQNCSGDLLVKVSDGGGIFSSSAAWDIYHLQAFSESLDAGKPGTGGSTSGSSGTTGTTVSKPASTSITSIKAGKQKATIYWKKASNATGYYLYRSTSANGTYKKIATVTGKTSYTDKKSLKSKHTYYYKVISFRKSGSKVLRSKASPYKKVKIK